MSAEVFLDTNIFIYQLERLDTFKASKAQELIYRGIADGNATISFQVVQECLNIILRKSEVPLEESQAIRYLDTVLYPLWSVMPNHDLYISSLHIKQRYKFSFFDSLIIASALEAGCNILYTEDLQHAQQIQNLYIMNPFLSE